MNAPREVVFWETLHGDGLISRTRSQLATKFLLNDELKDADVMVILDDDVHFQPADLWKIVDGARATGDLYGGVYVTRSRDPHPASQKLAGTALKWQVAEERNPAEIRYLATGFMAIPRAVLAAMVESTFTDVDGQHTLHYCEEGVGHLHMYDFFRPFVIRDNDRDGRLKLNYLSEDYAFCERARQCGFKVWADQSIFLGHRAVVSITVNDLGDTGHAVSSRGAPSKGSSILVTQPEGEMGATVEEAVSSSGQ